MGVSNKDYSITLDCNLYQFVDECLDVFVECALFCCIIVRSTKFFPQRKGQTQLYSSYETYDGIGQNIHNYKHSEQYVFEKLAYYKKNKINPANYMKVTPIPFSTQGAKMLQHAKSLLEDKDNL
jgi:hypothetical protein